MNFNWLTICIKKFYFQNACLMNSKVYFFNQQILVWVVLDFVLLNKVSNLNFVDKKNMIEFLFIKDNQIDFLAKD